MIVFVPTMARFITDDIEFTHHCVDRSIALSGSLS